MLKMNYVGETDLYDVGFSTIGNNIVQLTGTFPVQTKGFMLSRPAHTDAWDYTKFTTVYRELDGMVQFSNDGSVWVEPTVTKTISAAWDDGDDYEKVRPETVEVVVNKNGTDETVELTAENGWAKNYEDVPESQVYSISSAADVDLYEKTVNGMSVTYKHEYVAPPTLEERVAELETTQSDQDDAITDLSDAIFNANDDTSAEE